MRTAVETATCAAAVTAKTATIATWATRPSETGKSIWCARRSARSREGPDDDAPEEDRRGHEHVRQEEDRRVERLLERPEAEQRQRREDDDDGDEQPHGAAEQRGERRAEPRPLEHRRDAPPPHQVVRPELLEQL